MRVLFTEDATSERSLRLSGAGGLPPRKSFAMAAMSGGGGAATGGVGVKWEGRADEGGAGVCTGAEGAGAARGWEGGLGWEGGGCEGGGGMDDGGVG